MKITFLGTGTSQGVPAIACDCEVCTSTDPKDKRLRVSIHIEIEGKSFIIDAGPDFRQQVLREKILHLDALILTHEHRDHIAGLDDIRGFNFQTKEDIPVYASKHVFNELKKTFFYIFTTNKYPGIPEIASQVIKNKKFEIAGIEVTPIQVWHYKLPIFGYRIQDFSFITDASRIEDCELEKMMGSKVVVLNALQKKEHISHFALAESIDILQRIKPERAYLVHMSHLMGLHEEIEAELPDFIHLAYDGLKIEV